MSGRGEHKPGRRNGFLMLIAVFKFCKAALLVVVGLGAFKIVQGDITDLSHRVLSHLNSSVGRKLAHQALVRIADLDPLKLEALGVVAFLSAALFCVEGIGLWFGKRWAEYLTVIVTALLVPFEIYELVEKLTVARVTALVLNLAVIAYLVYVVRRPGSHSSATST